MDNMVAEYEGVVGVYLEDGDIGCFHHAALIGVGGRERDEAVCIRHGGSTHINIGFVTVEPLGSGEVQMVGDIRHIALSVSLAHGRGKEPAVNGESLSIFGLVELTGVSRVAVNDLDIADLAQQSVHVLHEHAGFGCTETGDDRIASLYEGKCFFKRDNFRCIVH